MYRWRSSSAILAGLITFTAVVMLAVIVFLPRLMVPEPSASSLQELTPKDQVQIQTDRLKARNDARGSLFQAISAIVFLATVFMGLRQYAVTQAQTRLSQHQADQNAQLSYEGLVTERFTQVLGLLGSEKLAVRVGGIYALERIARDSPTDRKAVRDVLIAYLRSDSHRPPPHNDVAEDLPWLAISAPDRQAAFTVLASGRSIRDWGDETVELNSVDLRKASLRQGHLEGFDLAGADMRGSDLRGARLEGARLEGANLTGARADRDTVWPQGFQWKAVGVILNDR
jgi:Pentapeptide repeats (8 copies)